MTKINELVARALQKVREIEERLSALLSNESAVILKTDLNTDY